MCSENTAFLFCMLCTSYLLWRAQDLANLEYGVNFAGAWEKRSEGIKLRHDAAHGPLVYLRTVGGGPEEHLRGSVPGDRVGRWHR